MKHLSLPDPPAADSPQFRGNALAFQRAASDWMARAKGLIQSAHNDVASPCGQQMLATSFVLNTVATGTTTGTDLSNVVASLISVLTQKGILSPTASRSHNQ